MEGERENTRDQNEGSGQQQPIDQQNQSQQEVDQDQPGSTGGATGQQFQGGFVGSQDEDSGEYLQQSGSPESGFAEQGRGASNDSGNIEGNSQRSQDSDSDIEGSSDNI